MEIGGTNRLSNLSFSQPADTSGQGEQPPNAFGIGSANQPEVQLSPQARILQQTEQNQSELREGLENARNQENGDSEENTQNELSGSEFVRVSSSVGTTARNNLSTERAAEVYQSIQDLL